MNLELIHSIEKMGNVKIHIEGEDLYVDGSLHLSGCTGLTELPENLHVRRYLYLRGCTGLTKLPENLHVGGGLLLCSCTGLTELPENLHARSCLFLDGCINLKSNEHYIISEEIDSCLNKAVYKISTGVVKCGLFSDTLDEFEKRADDVYPSGEYFEQLDKYIELCRSHQLKKI